MTMDSKTKQACYLYAISYMQSECCESIKDNKDLYRHNLKKLLKKVLDDSYHIITPVLNIEDRTEIKQYFDLVDVVEFVLKTLIEGDFMEMYRLMSMYKKKEIIITEDSVQIKQS